jgi:hypothetical protein
MDWSFLDLNSSPLGREDIPGHTDLPEPTNILNRKFPVCSIIRRTNTVGVAKVPTADGLFIG